MNILLSSLSLRRCSALLAFFGCSFGVPAQTTITSVGSPNGAALYPVEHGFVNLGNGDLHLEIPITTIPQRGDLSLGAKLVYDSSIWEIVDAFGTYVWSPTNGGGWSLQYGQNFSSSASIAETACPHDGSVTVYSYTKFNWSDPHGTVHVFPLKTVDLNGCSTTSQTDTPTAQGFSIDGSGYYGKVTGYTTLTVWDPTGTQVLQTQVPSAGGSAAQVIDRNGNYIQYGSDGVVSSDSLAHTPIAETVGATDSNGAPTVLFLDVPIAQSPSGQAQTGRYTITYETIGVLTSFNVSLSGSSISESYTNVRVIKSLGLPDGSSYQFSYDQTCPTGSCVGSPTPAYGLLTGVTLPHSGTVSYAYQSDANAGSTEPPRWISSYTGSNGNTTFAYAYEGPYAPVSETGDYSCGKVQNVATSAVLVSTYVFSSCGGAIQTMKVIQSPATSPQTVDSLTLYAYDFSHPCENGACTGPQWIELSDSTVILPSSGTTNGILSGTGGSGVISDTQTSYAAPGSGKISAVKQWDYYTANYQTTLPDTPPGNATRETDTAFAYTVNNALYPTDLTVKDSTGTVASEVMYSYDQSGLSQSPSGTPNHSNSLAASVRGNLTSVQQIPHGGVGMAPTLQNVFSYDDAGSVTSLQDPNTNISTLAYDATDTFPQTVTRPTTFGLGGPISHVTSSVMDFNTGLPISTTDENQQTTTYNYDTFGRLHTVAYSNAGSPVTLKTLTYPSVNETDLSTLQSQSSNGTVLINSSSFVDGYGRPSSSLQDGVSSETVYNAQGQIYSVTNYHLGTTVSPTDGTSYFSYDELGRTNGITMPTTYGSTITYSLNTVTITDPLHHQRQQTFDAFGNLSSVGEPDATGAFNWITKYNYNGLGRLTEIDQKGGSTDPTDWRRRYFTYDGLGRVYSQNTPEAGQYTYGYDNNGNVTSSLNHNPSNNAVSYFYDALNRIVLKQVGGGPSYTYTYDAQDTSGDSYGRGRLTSISNGGNTRANFTHDQFGRLVTQAERRPGDCNYIYRASAGYDYQGNLVSLTYPDGRTIQTVYDTFNRPVESVYTAWNGNPTSPPNPYYVGATYWPTGVLQGVTDGSGVQVSATYDPNQNIASLQYANNGANLLSAAYTFDKNGLNLTKIVDTASGRTQNFHYDWLDRINTSSDTGTTSAGTNPNLPAIPSSAMSFNIDQWGNLNQSGNYSFIQSIGKNNQIDSPDYLYDSAGNLKSESLGAGIVNSYTYRADGHQASSNGVNYTYDAQDNRVTKSGSSTTQYFYFGSTLLATLDASGAWNDMLYGVHGILGTVAGNPGAQPVYRIGDHLDSVAQTTDVNGNTLGGAAVLPFGQTLSNTTGSNFVFTGLEQDTENFSVAAAFRQYSPGQGRWLSPDPSAESYNFADPQSLNRYSYVLNQPLAATDPSGLGPLFNAYLVAFPSRNGGFSAYGWYDGGDGGSYLWGSDSATTITPEGLSPAAFDSGFSSREGYRYNGPGSNAAHDSPQTTEAPSKPNPKCATPIMQPAYTSIFGRMGSDLGVNPLFIMSSALQESGWNLAHVFGTNSSSGGKPLNNLFGMTRAGGNNIAYPSVWASAQAWEANWGPYLKNNPQTIQAYAADLTSNPAHMYNSNPSYPGALAARYSQLVSATAACKVTF